MLFIGCQVCKFYSQLFNQETELKIIKNIYSNLYQWFPLASAWMGLSFDYFIGNGELHGAIFSKGMYVVSSMVVLSYHAYHTIKNTENKDSTLIRIPRQVPQTHWMMSMIIALESVPTIFGEGHLYPYIVSGSILAAVGWTCLYKMSNERQTNTLLTIRFVCPQH